MSINALRSRQRITASSDPLATKFQRIMYLDFENTSGSTAFIDRCNNFTFTNTGSPYLDTSQKYSGSSSGYFDGSSAISAVANKLFKLSDNDFMIFFAFKRADSTSGEAMFGQNDSGLNLYNISVDVRFTSGNNVHVLFGSGNATVSMLSDSALTDTSSWHTVRIIRERDLIKFYLDSVLQAATIDASNLPINYSANKISFGQRGETTTTRFKGWLDMFSFWNGIRSY